MSDKVIIFVLGGPGSGKGTQSAKLVDEFQFHHISAGDLLREEVKQPNSQYGETISNCMKDGLLVPLEITINLLKKELDKSTDTKFLVDGFPREMDQAKEFESLIGEPSHVLYFSCSEEVMLERLLERGKTSGRSDDNEESIQKRFVTFKETSLPVIDYYKEKGKVSEILCEQSPDEVYQNTRQAVISLGLEPVSNKNIENTATEPIVEPPATEAHSEQVEQAEQAAVAETEQVEQPPAGDDTKVKPPTTCCLIL